jgi:Na+/proline symporter
MTTLDWVTIGLYFGLLAGLTWWSVARNRDTADDYFLAGRNLGWVVVGAIGRVATMVHGRDRVRVDSGHPGRKGLIRLTCRGLRPIWAIAAVFFFGVFMRRLTGAGCLAALLTGFGRRC